MRSSFSANDDISTTRHGNGVLALLLFDFPEQDTTCTPSANGVSATLLQHYIHDPALQIDAPFPSRLTWQGKRLASGCIISTSLSSLVSRVASFRV